MNKDKAMQMLKAKLYLLRQQENEEKLSGIRGEASDIGWGIRSALTLCSRTQWLKTTGQAKSAAMWMR